MTYRMTAQDRGEIVVVCLNPPLQFRLLCELYGPGGPLPPGLIRLEGGDHDGVFLTLINSDFGGGGRWHYRAVKPVAAPVPPAFIMEGRAPNEAELADMDFPERQEWTAAIRAQAEDRLRARREAAAGGA